MSIRNGPSRGEVVAAARGWLGTPYLHKASTRGEGTDCLGLVRGVWRELYGEEPEAVPAYTPDWNERKGDEQLLEAAERYLDLAGMADLFPGNVVLFRMLPRGPAKHLGILSDTDRFIHAYAGRAVSESWLSRWWLSRIVGLYAFPGVAE